jgi:AcrR family transcriptional regulator
MSGIYNSNYTPRSRFTRKCIGEAMIELLKTKELEDISVSDIVKKTGISRRTYYHYYHSKFEPIRDYLNEIISDYYEYYEHMKGPVPIKSYSNTLYYFTFFEQYEDCLLTLQRSNLRFLILDAINDFDESYVLPIFDGSVYELYYYNGAVLNTFLKWLSTKDHPSKEEMATLIQNL